MTLPFTAEQFLLVFERYNLSVFPMQIPLLLLALAALALSFSEIRSKNRMIAGILAFFWVWTGIAYHLIFFTSINKGAYLFGGLFVLQGILFLSAGARGTLSFRFQKNVPAAVGAVFITYALVVYPALNYIFGHWWPYNPTFGLPCPTAIFTFGILLWTDKKVPGHILVIPVLWSLIGASAAVDLGIWEDLGLVISGVTGTLLLWARDRGKY